MEDIQEIIDSGVDLDFQDSLGLTLLIASAKKGNLNTVQQLVSNGARVNIKDNKNFCALYYATQSNHLDIVKYLLNNGAVLNDEIYMTAIYKNYKNIHKFFDTLDASKKILKDKR